MKKGRVKSAIRFKEMSTLDQALEKQTFWAVGLSRKFIIYTWQKAKGVTSNGLTT
jgi:hypothetical protein